MNEEVQEQHETRLEYVHNAFVDQEISYQMGSDNDFLVLRRLGNVVD